MEAVDGLFPWARSLLSVAGLAAVLMGAGCHVLQAWTPTRFAEEGIEVPPELNKGFLGMDRPGFFGWRAGVSKVGIESVGGGNTGMTRVAPEFDFPLTTPEDEQLEVRCRTASIARAVEHQGHRWRVGGHDCECFAFREDVDAPPVARLMLVERDDRRRVGRVELDGMAVQVAALGLYYTPGEVAPWEIVPMGHTTGYLLAIDGRTVGHLAVVSPRSLRLEPELTPEMRRALGLAATLLAVIKLNSYGAG